MKTYGIVEFSNSVSLFVSGNYSFDKLDEGSYSDELWNDGYRCGFKPVRITVSVKKGLPEQLPEVCEFFGNYSLTSGQTAMGLSYMNENGAMAEEAADCFLAENMDIWIAWVDSDTADKMKKVL